MAIIHNLAVLRERIRKLREMPAGWHSGEGEPATRLAADNATAIGGMFMKHGAQGVEAFPERDGGVTVSAYRDRATVEVVCGPKGAFHLTVENRGDIKEDRTMVDLPAVEARIGAWA